MNEKQKLRRQALESILEVQKSLYTMRMAIAEAEQLGHKNAVTHALEEIVSSERHLANASEEIVSSERHLANASEEIVSSERHLANASAILFQAAAYDYHRQRHIRHRTYHG